MHYSKVPNKHPPLINFLIFFQPPTPYKNPPLINCKEIDSIYKHIISFPFFISTIYTHISWQNSILLYIFSMMLYDNLFLFFPSLYNHLKSFLKFQPPSILNLPLFITFQNFFRPPCLLVLPQLFGNCE